MWIPVLLYEPTCQKGKMPVVLNPNGHHAGGKAMDYKQARCINLAKRGMIALNIEFDGQDDETQPSQKLRDKINKVLTSNKIIVRNIICSDPMDDTLEKLDVVSIPAVLVFDSSGKLARKFDGEIDYKNDVVPFVAELVANAEGT